MLIIKAYFYETIKVPVSIDEYISSFPETIRKDWKSSGQQLI